MCLNANVSSTDPSPEHRVATEPISVELTEPWLTRSQLIEIGLRAVLLFGLGALFLQPRTLGLCAWTIVPLTLIEYRAARRGRASYDVAVTSFLCGFLALLVAYFQVIYTNAMIATGSIIEGTDAVGGELAFLFKGAGFAPVIILVFIVQCLAVGCAVATVFRVPGPMSGRLKVALGSWGAFVCLVPCLDWLVFEIVQGSSDLVSMGPTVLLFSGILLAIGSAAASIAMLLFCNLTSALAAGLSRVQSSDWPAGTSSPGAPPEEGPE